MKVFKFGGASVKDSAGIKNVASILQNFRHESLVIVVSAMGKTTNALEEVVNAYAKKTGQAFALLQKIKQQHEQIMAELFDDNDEVYSHVNDTFVEVEWVIEENMKDEYDYIYDQIVSIGEMVSTKILAAYLQKVGLPTHWLDVRDVILTDDTYREAQVQWKETVQRANARITPLLEKGGFVLTQGFIGVTTENHTTTLGREGSDYTAAILSYCLNADSMSIWKDVSGVLTADPRLFNNVIKLDRLSYMEAIEMTYYGASVIHPKTIQPLQNKNIPLYVKSFLQPEASGTVITGDAEEQYPPIVVVEKNQAMLQISPRDFSFIIEHHLADLFRLCNEHRIIVNMMQNTAISFLICVTNHQERVQQFTKAIEKNYKVVLNEGLELVTVRHFNEETLAQLKKGKMMLLEERIPKTVQMVMKDVPVMERKG